MPDRALIRQLAAKHFHSAKEIRRHLHRYPELSFQEFETSEFIQQQLKNAQIKFTTGHVKTGIIGTIEGKEPQHKTILLRADMDALPIQEMNKTEYRSQNDGVMHACGHDVHSACLLGALFVLNEVRDKFRGTVKFMFQPGEEVLPGGASLMIEEGVLRNPDVHKAIALHVHPSMETGWVGFRKGVYMASTDELYVSVHGKSGHAAMPADYVNPLIAAAAFLLEVQKNFMAKDALKGTKGEKIPTVVAFGKIEGMGATNVIPEQVRIAGTFRTMDESWRTEVHDKIRSLADSVSKEYGVKIELRVERGYPVLRNDPDFTGTCSERAGELLGKEHVEELPLRMTAEDFAYITHRVPSCFFRLGTGNKKAGITSGVHTPTFDVDERAIETGIGLLAWFALSELQ
jgi:amidohydrolase